MASWRFSSPNGTGSSGARLVAAAGVALAVVALGGAAVGFAATALQQDFAAYWVAGAARRAGLDPYVNHLVTPDGRPLWDGVAPFRHSRFLYPPLVADLLRPLAALPFRAAKAIFTAASGAALIAAAALAGRCAAAVAGGPADAAGARRASRAFVAAAALFFPVYLVLERGQVDLLLLPVLLLAWRWRDRAAAAGPLLALAALFKPALLGLLPVVAALGRWRAAAATVAAFAALLGLGAATGGRALTAAYLGTVLPRAALYGEGGTEAMLLHEPAFEAAGLLGDDAGEARVDGRTYARSAWDALLPWPLSASASLPRLLAPSGPSRATALGPYVVAAAALIAAARRLRRRRRHSTGPAGVAEAWLALAALIACVVTSSAGWVMGLCGALPLAAHRPWRRRAIADGPDHPGARAALGASWIACAIPAPLAGWGAVAGTSLAAAVVWMALRLADREAAPPC